MNLAVPQFRESRRMRTVQSPIIPTVNELIRTNPGTVSLGQGMAYYGPPAEAMQVLQRFGAELDDHKYKAVHGIDALLEEIHRKLQLDNGIEVGRDQRIVVTAGSNMGFISALMAITDPADEVILNLPFYFNHEMAIEMLNCKAVCVATDDNYQLQFDAIENAITDRTRAIVTVSPNNPAGVVYSEADLRAVNTLCRNAGIYHISDEAYEYFLYDQAEHFSPASATGSSEHTITLQSLSKSYGFASWRVGWMVVPVHLFSALKKAQDTILICPPVVSQQAAVAAMQVGAGYCRERLKTIAATRQLMLHELSKLNEFVSVPQSDGAFYLLLKVATDIDSITLTERLIKEYRVAVIPGDAFGPTDACYLRVSYGALTQEQANSGIERLTQGLLEIRNE